VAADLQGNVAVGGAPVAGSKVILTNKPAGKVTTTTDATGSYQFDPVAAGSYKIIIGSFTVPGTTTVSGALQVKGAPSVGTKVKLKNVATGVTVNTTTDASGAFSFASVAPGKYKITLPKVTVP
jgi:hypothetical protein